MVEKTKKTSAPKTAPKAANKTRAKAPKAPVKAAATAKSTAKKPAPATIQIKHDRVAIVGGVRSPFTKAWTTLNDVGPVDLSTQVARELMFQLDLPLDIVDEVVWGTVIAVPSSPNIAREVCLNLGMYRVPGFTVTRACATGLQAAASAAEMIQLGHADVVIAGGVDVTSHAPVTYKKRVIDHLQKAQRQKGVQLMQTIAQINPLDLLPSPPALTERYTGLTMGQHAEEMAQNFNITREAQEALALASHRNAHRAVTSGRIDSEVVTVLTPKGTPVREDNLIRGDMDAAKIARLRPAFDRKNGTITAATSSALTDGASCVLLMRESKAKELGLKPLGFLRSYAFAALDPRENMLLGNAYSIPTALDRAGVKLGDMDVVEIHEAFAAQVLSNMQCMASESFNQKKLGRSAVGEVDRSKLNLWGGSMAYGHPFAATGGRLIRQLLDILAAEDGELGIASACAAGGMGAAMVVERAS